MRCRGAGDDGETARRTDPLANTHPRSPEAVFAALDTDQGRASFWAESAIEVSGQMTKGAVGRRTASGHTIPMQAGEKATAARRGGDRHGTTLLLSAATTLLHLLTARGYGIFRDELYYLACSQRLDWGYVDHPPLIAAVAWLVRNTVGTSLPALRLMPALAAGGLVWLTAAITRELGGGRFAQVLAALAVALAPVYLSMFSIFSMNALDILVWAALVFVLVRILNTGNGRLWLTFGVLAGLGLQNKLSVLFLGGGLAAGLVAARGWQHLRDRRLWLGLLVAGVIFAPHVAWQVANGWPTAEFVRRATEIKNVAFSAVGFVAQQVLLMNPIALPVWLAGVWYLIFAARGRPYRTLGFAYVVIVLVMMTTNSKPYYLAPVYPVLFAAGSLVVERAAQARAGWLRPAAICLLGISGLLLAPLAKPLLPVDRYVRYAAALGVEPSTDERHRLGRLPQFFADMHGWPELAEAVTSVHRRLPPPDRAHACVFAQNYGEAGAIEYFAPGLPVISGHNSYWLWGPGRCDGDVMIVIGGRAEDLERSFATVEAAGRFDCQDCMPYEDGQILWVARGLREPVADVWPGVKHFD